MPAYATAYLRDTATGQILFDINGYPLFNQQTLWNDGGVLSLPSHDIEAQFGYPTSPVGLSPGAIYSDGLAVAIVPGFTPVVGAAVYFGSISAGVLLALGGTGFPTSPGPTGSLLIYSNGYLLCVS